MYDLLLLVFGVSAVILMINKNKGEKESEFIWPWRSYKGQKTLAAFSQMTQVLSQRRRTAHLSDKHRAMSAFGIRSASSDYQQSFESGRSVFSGFVFFP